MPSGVLTFSRPFAILSFYRKQFVSIFTTIWDKWGKNIVAIFKAAWDIMYTFVTYIIKQIQTVINIFTFAFQGDWDKVWYEVGQLFVNAWEFMKNILPQLLEGIFEVMRGAFTIFKDIGTGMFNAVWDGMKSIWESISNWVSEKVDWLVDKLAFWKKSKKQMGGEDDYDGSHAGGLAYVPFDGYRAELHRGERVLTAEENRRLSTGRFAGGGKTIIQNITINSPSHLSPSETARQLRNASRELAMGV